MDFDGGAAIIAGLVGGAAMMATGFLMLHILFGVLVGAVYQGMA